MLCKETNKILRCCIKKCDGKPAEISKSVMKANLFNIGANNNVSAMDYEYPIGSGNIHICYFHCGRAEIFGFGIKLDSTKLSKPKLP